MSGHSKTSYGLPTIYFDEYPDIPDDVRTKMDTLLEFFRQRDIERLELAARIWDEIYVANKAKTAKVK